MDPIPLNQRPMPLPAEAAERSALGSPRADASRAHDGTLGTLRIHGLGVVETFVVMEPDLNQLFAESELSRDAGAWLFCSLGVLGGAVTTLATFAATERNFDWRYTIVCTVTAVSLVLSLKMYVAWRKHSEGYRRIERQLRTRSVSALVDLSLAAEAPLQRIQRVDEQ